MDFYGDLDIPLPYHYDDNDYITISQESIIKAYEKAGYEISIDGISQYERGREE